MMMTCRRLSILAAGFAVGLLGAWLLIPNAIGADIDNARVWYWRLPDQYIGLSWHSGLVIRSFPPDDARAVAAFRRD